MMSWYSCLCLLLSMFHSASQSLSSPFSPSHRPRCHSSESAALIQFRNSFSIENYNDSSSDCDYYFGISNPNTTLSWDSTTDCCTWSGVECDEFTARVVGLHLKCGGLRGVINSNIVASSTSAVSDHSFSLATTSKAPEFLHCLVSSMT